jgi:hypothetical protein
MTCNAVFYDETVPDDIKRVLQSHEVDVRHTIEGSSRLIWRHEDWDQDRKLCVLYKSNVSDQCCLAEFSPDEIQGCFDKVLSRIEVTALLDLAD